VEHPSLKEEQLTTTRTRLLAATIAIGAAVAITTAGSAAMAYSSSGHLQNTLRERLSSYAETPVALSTAGSGQFRVQINEQKQEITYELSYTGLEGTVTQSHIHFGSAAQSGGISVFLCSNLGNGPAGTQACPAAPGTVTGTLTPASVIGPAGQGIAAGEFAELVAAIRAGSTYVNVHSTLFPAGEIRAQLD
jgi:hypothetical protein